MTSGERPDSSLDRLPPQNPEAEEAVLGSCLMDPDAVHLIKALRREDFYRERNGAIYQAIRELADDGTKIDFVTVTDKLQANGRYEEVGGLTYLANLIGVVPTAVHVEYYANIVRQLARRRRGISACGRIASMLYDTSGDVDEVTSKALQHLGSALISSADAGVHSPEDRSNMLLDMVLKLEEDRERGTLPGLMAGFNFDRSLRGMYPGEVILLASRPGMGKSTIVHGIARRLALQGKKVLFASSEMVDQELIQRDVGSITGVDWDILKARLLGEEPEPAAQELSTAALLAKAGDAIAKMGLSVYDVAGMTSFDLAARAAREKAVNGLDLVVIDYVQRLADSKGANDNDNDRIEGISGRICDMAKRLEVPVLMVSQLTRAVEYREDKRPTLADLRGSGSLEQDAHAVLFLYRDDYYDRTAESKGIAELCIAKHRTTNGGAGTIYRLVWRSEAQEYANYQPEAAGDPPVVERKGRKRGGRYEQQGHVEF